MSYSQFAEVITSMNQGTGVPVTIRHIQGKEQIGECPFTDKKQQIEDVVEFERMENDGEIIVLAFWHEDEKYTPNH